MQGSDNSGFDKERFPHLTGEAFDCVICAQVVKNPKECTSCGNMFCASCIDAWIQKKERMSQPLSNKQLLHPKHRQGANENI